MNAYVTKEANWSQHGAYLFKCSDCNDTIASWKDPGQFKFCWRCGVKFGPEPRTGPTAGEWYYDQLGGAIRAMPNGVSVAHVLSRNTVDEMKANAHLMAASKKLLAACKVVALARDRASWMEKYDPKAMEQVKEAIAEAEKGKQ